MAGFVPAPAAGDPLEQFLVWFEKQRLSIGLVPLLGAVHKIEDVYSVKWYQEGQFQIQLFIVPPNYIIPEHTHPNVDSYEVYVGGQIRFSKHGKYTARESMFTQPDDNGCSQLRRSVLRVRPHDKHGGVFGPGGGVFMSVQHWLNGVKPHCVAADYTGTVMGRDHMSRVVCGEAVLKETLTAVDAAPNEPEN
jgi:hypothetical protein